MVLEMPFGALNKSVKVNCFDYKNDNENANHSNKTKEHVYSILMHLQTSMMNNTLFGMYLVLIHNSGRFMIPNQRQHQDTKEILWIFWKNFICKMNYSKFSITSNCK